MEIIYTPDKPFQILQQSLRKRNRSFLPLKFIFSSFFCQHRQERVVSQVHSQRVTVLNFLRHSRVTWVWLVVRLRNLGRRAARRNCVSTKGAMAGRQWPGKGIRGKKSVTFIRCEIGETACLMENALDPHHHPQAHLSLYPVD